jgi:hypothetical protein
MPLNKKKTNNKKYIFWAIAIVLLALMIVSFAPQPEFTETVLYQ